MNFVFRWGFRFPKRFVFGIYQSFNWMPSKDKYLRKNMSLHFAEVSIYISFSANVAPIAFWHHCHGLIKLQAAEAKAGTYWKYYKHYQNWIVFRKLEPNPKGCKTKQKVHIGHCPYKSNTFQKDASLSLITMMIR